jgi:hypothetical protein
MKKLKILGYDYKIEYLENDSMKAFGRFNAEKQSILIGKDLPKDLQKSSLVHEIIEALNFYLELELPHNKITSLEAGLYQVFKDNPDVIKYLN